MHTRDTSPERARPSVGVQVRRGILWTAYVLGIAIALVATLDLPPGAYDGREAASESPYWQPHWLRVGIVIVVALAVVWLTRRWRTIVARLGRVRPRWLVPVVGVVAASALAIAASPFKVEQTTDFIGKPTLSCVPILAAAKHVHPRPSPQDIRVWHDLHFLQPPLPVRRHDRAAARAALTAFRAKITAIEATPAYRRADAYMMWKNTDAACAPESRHRVLLATLVLVAGLAAAFGAAAIDRRRTRSRPDRDGRAQVVGAGTGSP